MMDLEVFKHRYHQNHYHQQDNNHQHHHRLRAIENYDNSHQFDFNVCVHVNNSDNNNNSNNNNNNNNNCVMSRLSPPPYTNAEHGTVPISYQGDNDTISSCPPLGAIEPSSPVFQPDSSNGVPIGLNPSGCLLQPYSRVIHSPCLQLDGMRYESSRSRLDPHSPLCMVPLPEHIGEPSFIRRRNERERERVRCVNDGYDRLKEHLPLADKDRRLSKVETLRGAIDYIRELKSLLEESAVEHSDMNMTRNTNSVGSLRNKRFVSSSSLSRKHRSSSLSSSDHDSSLSDS